MPAASRLERPARGVVVGTENDTLNAMTMLFEHLLTDRPASSRTCVPMEPRSRAPRDRQRLRGRAKDGVIHLLNSGAASLDGTGAVEGPDGNPVIKPFYEMTQADADACLKATDWCAADQFYFRGGGYSSHFVGGTKGDMPVTMARLNLVAGLGPVLQLAEGYTCELDRDVHEKLDQRTDPTWPTTWFAPILTGKGAFADVYSVMANWGANHGAFCYGHVGDLLITMASMLRIPVCMHNVAEERIFRPSTWAAFGTADLEGADYRACAALGPLYLTRRTVRPWGRRNALCLRTSRRSSPGTAQGACGWAMATRSCSATTTIRARAARRVRRAFIRADGHGVPELLDARFCR